MCHRDQHLETVTLSSNSEHNVAWTACWHMDFECIVPSDFEHHEAGWSSGFEALLWLRAGLSSDFERFSGFRAGSSSDFERS